MLRGIRQVWNTDCTLSPPIAAAQIIANPALRRPDIGIIARIKNHQLNITEERLDGIIIRATRWQRDPVQLELPHLAARLPRLAGM